MARLVCNLSLCTFCLTFLNARAAHAADADQRIQPSPENPWYWQYEGRPVVLVGGSDDDNLFQWPDLEPHLERIAAAGGNYIRNTMSDRPDKGFELYPFRRLDNGKYDLSEWNDEYWRRFENMLRWTHDRDIIVQIELWDRFDYSADNWQKHPYNPGNNVNYTYKQSGFAPEYRAHAGRNEQPFFYTVPELRNNQAVLPFQIAQVDKLLSYALEYPNVLYCMDNETSGAEEWGRFWAEHIRSRAKERGVDAQLTEMWDDWNPLGAQHKRTFDHPELYTFIDVSQNNHNRGEEHWRNLMAVRDYVADHPRPINTVKIYGADGGQFGNSRDGEERFWRNLIGGVAGTRFHRPDSGLGLTDRALPHLRSARMLFEKFDVLRCRPDARHQLLSNRSENEAFLSYEPGNQYAVYFPDGGAVDLNLKEADGGFQLRWLNVAESKWQGMKTVRGGHAVTLEAPGEGHWVCLVTNARGQQ
jgi:hypothetical protein